MNGKFHAEAGFYFQRTAQGFVRMTWERPSLVPDEPPEILAAINFTPDTWASIVASVSALGENGTTFHRAREFHNALRLREVTPMTDDPRVEAAKKAMLDAGLHAENVGFLPTDRLAELLAAAALRAADKAAGWEQVGWGEASSEWVSMDENGVETTPAISFTDDIDPRPEWAEFAVYRLRPGGSGEAPSLLDEAAKALEWYAPANHVGGVHMEECWFDADDWLWERWLEDFDDTPEVPAHYAAKKVAFNAWKVTQPAPTDTDLCADGCTYPAARALLARLRVENTPK